MMERQNKWTEEASQDFVEYSRYFVPARETQINLISSLIPPRDDAFEVIELGCGEGLLAETILQQHPTAIVQGYDGSPTMLAKAKARLSSFGSRFIRHEFDLFDYHWRKVTHFVHAVVSSLTIHHLDGPQKQMLFEDVYHMLHQGGAFIVADLVQPANELATAVAAQAWDEAVRARALALAGTDEAYEEFTRSKWNIFTHPDPMDKPSPIFEQLQWLKEAGFTAVDVYWMQAGHAIYGGQKS